MLGKILRFFQRLHKKKQLRGLLLSVLGTGVRHPSALPTEILSQGPLRYHRSYWTHGHHILKQTKKLNICVFCVVFCRNFCHILTRIYSSKKANTHCLGLLLWHETLCRPSMSPQLSLLCTVTQRVCLRPLDFALPAPSQVFSSENWVCSACPDCLILFGLRSVPSEPLLVLACSGRTRELFKLRERCYDKNVWLTENPVLGFSAPWQFLAIEIIFAQQRLSNKWTWTCSGVLQTWGQCWGLPSLLSWHLPSYFVSRSCQISVRVL